MKKTSHYTFIVALFVSVFMACNTNNDNNPQPTGDPRDKFVGTWNCAETSKMNGSSSFAVTISLNQNNTSQILLANYYHLGTTNTVYGVVANNNVAIPSQLVSSLTVHGNGNYQTGNSSIVWDYYVDPGGDPDTCHAVFTK